MQYKFVENAQETQSKLISKLAKATECKVDVITDYKF